MNLQEAPTTESVPTSRQVFYRQWRPQTFADIVGQEHVTRTLLNALAHGQVAHAYLFCGPRGTGKTSTGRILAKAVNCLRNDGRGEPCNECDSCRQATEGRALDLIEIDAASNRGIDEVRSLREKIGFVPNVGRYKVYIVDEVHMLTNQASNALLKTLEEPPPHAILVLATTEPHNVLPTVISRCQRFDFRRISLTGVVQRLRRICGKEGAAAEDAALEFIARTATGSLRDAENLLEQVISYYGNAVTLAQVRELLGVTEDERCRQFARAAIEGDLSAGIALINQVAGEGLDLYQFHRQLVEYLRGLLLIKSGARQVVDVPGETLREMEELAGRANMDELVRALAAFARVNLRQEQGSPLPLELALTDCVLPRIRSESAPPATPKREAPPTPAPRRALASRPEPAVATGGADLSLPLLEATPTATPAAASTGTEPRSVLDEIRSRWPQVMEAARQGGHRNVEALLRSACELVAADESTVTLGFAYPLLKDKMEETTNRRAAEEALRQVLGRQVTVRLVMHERPRRRADPRAMPLVRAAEELGARVIEVIPGDEDEPADTTSGAGTTG